MAKPQSKGVFEIECPCCRTAITLDADTGAILTHKQPEKPPVIEDLAVAAAKLKGESARREELFQKSFTEQKNKQSILEKQFDELFKKAKEDPDQAPPPRAFDLD